MNNSDERDHEEEEANGRIDRDEVCQHCPATADAAPLEHSIRCPARGARGVATVNPYDPAREDYYRCQACRQDVLVKDQPAHNLEMHSSLNSDLMSISLMDAMRAANVHGADTLSRVPTEEELDVARRHFVSRPGADPATVEAVAVYAMYFVDAGLKVMLATDPTNERVRRLAAMAAAAKAYADGPWRSVRPVG